MNRRQSEAQAFVKVELRVLAANMSGTFKLTFMCSAPDCLELIRIPDSNSYSTHHSTRCGFPTQWNPSYRAGGNHTALRQSTVGGRFAFRHSTAACTPNHGARFMCSSPICQYQSFCFHRWRSLMYIEKNRLKNIPLSEGRHFHVSPRSVITRHRKKSK